MRTLIAAHILVGGCFQFQCKLVDIAVNGGLGNFTGNHAAIVMKLSENRRCRHARIVQFKIFNLFL